MKNLTVLKFYVVLFIYLCFKIYKYKYILTKLYFQNRKNKLKECKGILKINKLIIEIKKDRVSGYVLGDNFL